MSVERLGPGLTRADVELLMTVPYARPAALPATVRRRRLDERHGLIERHPEQRNLWRCTELGERVVQAYAEAGWLAAGEGGYLRKAPGRR